MRPLGRRGPVSTALWACLYCGFARTVGSVCKLQPDPSTALVGGPPPLSRGGFAVEAADLSGHKPHSVENHVDKPVGILWNPRGKAVEISACGL